jgi:hypothetical protein
MRQSLELGKREGLNGYSERTTEFLGSRCSDLGKIMLSMIKIRINEPIIAAILTRQPRTVILIIFLPHLGQNPNSVDI